MSGKAEADDTKDWTTADFNMERELLLNDERLVRSLYRAGVPLLAGTDAGNSFGFPGFSLHDELALMVTSGLPPLAALQAATLNPSLFMGSSDRYGSIAHGKVADLVMLDADPPIDIHNTSAISIVFLAGREFDRSALDRILLTAAETAKATSTK